MSFCLGRKEFVIITNLNYHKVNMYVNETMSTKDKKETTRVGKSCQGNELIRHLKTKDISKGVK